MLGPVFPKLSGVAKAGQDNTLGNSFCTPPTSLTALLRCICKVSDMDDDQIIVMTLHQTMWMQVRVCTIIEADGRRV